ncbi:Spy/CpxP family protein refolding chaperone [Bradyrhizobium sp. STM 3562]|uniref:Spy/CpxP family protein refolding chaperone n=1 Tax=Bradyrhizobium sp. STM 3562 TaxID=578924 RepID=UPI00388D49F7
MSKSRIAVIVLLLATALSGAAFGRGGGGGGHGGGGHGGGGGGGGHGGGGHGGGHFGGGHFGGGHGGGHFAGGHFGGGHFGGHHGGAHFAGRAFSHGGRSFAGHGGTHFGQIRNAPVRAASIHGAMASLSHAGGLRNGRLLSNPAARGQIAAVAALAGWHGGNIGNGWWQHGNGFYGWVGPLFWPFAYYDIYDYTIWGDGLGFWDYGYPDIYAGIFAPYGYDDLSGYIAPPAHGRRHGRLPSVAQLCGDDSREIADLPIDQIQEAVQPNDAQRAALDELANASVEAAQTIRASCPTQVVLTAPNRLAAMQHRIEAMIAAVGIVRPPLEKFYGLLSDEQKERFNALAEDQRKAHPSQASLTQNCASARPAAFQWPSSEIEARVHPNDMQRPALQVLADASSRATDMLKAACPPDEAVTPPARLAAAATRLETMLQALKLVRPALDNFYGTLSDEQKAQFEAIGPRRTT